MIWLLAQLEEVNREAALKKGWWNLSFILLVGTIGVLFLIAIILLRRWKHKQIAEIEQDRAERRAGKTGERVDAWAASAQRYVDHDKLSPDDDLFEREDDRDDEEDGYPGDDSSQFPDEDRDPFGLFTDKPFQETDDEDDDYGDEDDQEDDWDDEDEDEDDKR